MSFGPILYCGDPHGQFRQVIRAAEQAQPCAVVLLGDMEPVRPLHEELAELDHLQVPVYWIPGNHDADSDVLWERVWLSGLAGRNIHGRVVTLPDGTRLAGLGGVFRESVWHPDRAGARQGVPVFRTRAEHGMATPQQDQWHGGHSRKHWGTIYPEELDRLSQLSADILVTHEAPGYHPHGFEIIDTLAQALGVKLSVHGHHHDSLDSSYRWGEQGFESRGVGLRGVSAKWPSGQWEVLVPGELNKPRSLASGHQVPQSQHETLGSLDQLTWNTPQRPVV
jgi:predicted phosphodiesterase